MSFHNLFKNAEARRLTIDGTNYILSAGTSDVNSGSVDTLGYEGVAFVMSVGVIASSGAVSVKVQQSSDDGAVDTYADVTGTAQGATADTDDNKLILIDIYRPKERYLRVATTRGDGGNSTIDGLIALLYRPINGAVTQGATVYGLETHNSPDAGTA